MPQLRLISLHCRKTEDWSGPDEAYLLVKGRRHWGPQSMNDGDAADLSATRPVGFQAKARIDLYDEDAGWPDDDDHLGRTYAREAQAGKGDVEHRFTGDGADYLLTYEVLPDTE